MSVRALKKNVLSFITVLALALPAFSTLVNPIPAAADGGSDSVGQTSISIEAISGGVPAYGPYQPGNIYQYALKWSCLSDCGAATLVLTLPHDVFFTAPPVVPTGAASAVVGTAGGLQTLTIVWDNFNNSYNGLIGIPVQVSSTALFSANDPHAVATVTFVADSLTAEDPEAKLVASADVILLIPENPGAAIVTGASNQDWTGGPLETGSHGDTAYFVTGRQNANLPSSLIFENPPAGDGYGVFDAFDLTSLEFDKNPAGAQVCFAIKDAAEVCSVVDAPDTTVTLPAGEIIGYRIEFYDVDPATTIKVTAGLQLRDDLRSSGDAVTNSTTFIHARTEITSKTPSGKTAKVGPTDNTMEVRIGQVSLAMSKTWQTALGDQASVYKTGEASKIDLRLANTSQNEITSIKLTEPIYANTGNVFDYEKITSAPTFTAPTGATTITVTYICGWGDEAVECGSSTLNAASAGWPVVTDNGVSLAADGETYGWEDVSQIVVEFTGAIAICPSDPEPDLTCAGRVEIPTALRDFRASDGDSIENERALTNVVPVVGQALSLRELNGSVTASFHIVPPQYSVDADKGLGPPEIYYLLTGRVESGDYYDSSETTAHEDNDAQYSDHLLTLTGGSSWADDAESSNAQNGPAWLLFGDPANMIAGDYGTSLTDVTEYWEWFNETNRPPFWNFVKLSSFSPTVSCVDTSDPDWADNPPIDIAASPVNITGYVVDSLSSPTAVTAVDLTAGVPASISPDQIVGLAFTVAPDAGGYFPVNVNCEIVVGDVRWRLNQVRTGDEIKPSDETVTPGLLSSNNSVEVRSNDSRGPNHLSYRNSSDAPLFLVDQVLASGAKLYGPDWPGTQPTSDGNRPDGGDNPKRSGVAGQGQVTSFWLVAATGEEDPPIMTLRLTDGAVGAVGTGNSFDIFALTGLRYAAIGPDQEMLVTLLDQAGDVVFYAKANLPTEGPTTCDELDNENSQSECFLKVQNFLRKLTWFEADGVTALSGQPTATQLVSVMAVVVDVTRLPGDGGVVPPLPPYSAARLVLDVALRSQTLTGTDVCGPGSDGEICGAHHPGKIYLNLGEIYRITADDDPEDLVPAATMPARFNVYEPSTPFSAMFIDWEGGPLVIDTNTPTSITMRAYNDSAIDIGLCPDNIDPIANPEEVWQCSRRLEMGISSLTVAVGAPSVDASHNNVFAIVDFDKLTGIVWPELINGDHAKAIISYTYANGDVVEMPPVEYTATGPTFEAVLAPAQPADPTNVVGISVTFDAGENGYIRTHSSADAGYSQDSPQASLTFSTILRDTVREADSTSGWDFPYTLAGPPGDDIDLNSGDPIVIADAANLWRWATVWLTGGHSLDEQPPVVKPFVDSALMEIWNEPGSMTISKDGGPLIYRDRISPINARDTTFSVALGNTGRSPVNEMRIGDSACLLDEASWPTVTPAACGFVPASATFDGTFDAAFDAFNLTSLTVTKWPTTVPSITTGAQPLQLTIWFLYADGTWNTPVAPTLAYSGQTGSTTIATTGIDMTQVVGFRISLKAVNGTRIANNTTAAPTQGNFTVQLNVRLRDYLRSDPSTRAPGDLAPDNGLYWEVPNTANGATYILKTNGELIRWAIGSDPKEAIDRVYPGTPSAVSIDQFDNFTGVSGSSHMIHVSPGAWTDFKVGVLNQATAYGALYDPVIVFQVPDGLNYDPGRPWTLLSTSWLPAGLTVDMIEADFDATTSTLTWTLPEGYYLMPGQAIVFNVPLRLVDGAHAGDRFYTYDTVMGHALVEPTTYTPYCVAPALPVAGYTGAPGNCQQYAWIEVDSSPNIRAAKFVAEGGLGVAEADGTTCTSATHLAYEGPWTDDSFWRDPCQSISSPGDEVTFRLMLINSGNHNITQMRFVDVLPALGDVGTISGLSRGSEYDTYLVGPPTLVSDGSITTDGRLRTDAVMETWYTTVSKPCNFASGDGAGTPTVLTCGASWDDSPGAWTDARAVKGEILFADPLEPGEYVLVDITVKLPMIVEGGLIGVNDLALSGLSGLGWLPATMSSASVAQISALTEVTVTQKCQGRVPAGVTLPYTITATYLDSKGVKQDVPLAVENFSLKCNQTIKITVPLNAEVTITQTSQKGSTLTSVMVGGINLGGPTITVLSEADWSATFTNRWSRFGAGGSIVGDVDLNGLLSGLLGLTAVGLVVAGRRRSKLA